MKSNTSEAVKETDGCKNFKCKHTINEKKTNLCFADSNYNAKEYWPILKIYIHSEIIDQKRDTI